MSKSKTAAKVLRVAIGRAQKGQWAKNAFKRFTPGGKDGRHSVFYCTNGLLTAGNVYYQTDAQRKAAKMVALVIRERFSKRLLTAFAGLRTELDDRSIIILFNDNAETTLDEVIEVLKLALIKLETGGDEEEEENFTEYVDDLFDIGKSKDMEDLLS